MSCNRTVDCFNIVLRSYNRSILTDYKNGNISVIEYGEMKYKLRMIKKCFKQTESKGQNMFKFFSSDLVLLKDTKMIIKKNQKLLKKTFFPINFKEWQMLIQKILSVCLSVVPFDLLFLSPPISLSFPPTPSLSINLPIWLSIHNLWNVKLRESLSRVLDVPLDVLADDGLLVLAADVVPLDAVAVEVVEDRQTWFGRAAVLNLFAVVGLYAGRVESLNKRKLTTWICFFRWKEFKGWRVSTLPKWKEASNWNVPIILTLAFNSFLNLNTWPKKIFFQKVFVVIRNVSGMWDRGYGSL